MHVNKKKKNTTYRGCFAVNKCSLNKQSCACRVWIYGDENSDVFNSRRVPPTARLDYCLFGRTDSGKLDSSGRVPARRTLSEEVVCQRRDAFPLKANEMFDGRDIHDKHRRR